MKLLATVVILIGLVGCASTRPQTNNAMSLQQLESIRVSNYKCQNIDQVVNTMENQLKMKGLSNVTPEDLNDEDRKYNATARIVIWSMRIGCNNPDRYSI
jgi:hypothetical protein